MRRIVVPDQTRLLALLADVLDSGSLTNNGPRARELTERLRDYLDVEHIVLTSSGTRALEIAFHALELTGEVLTTPLSWITTASSLTWVGLTPRFVDIEPGTLNLDASRIEAAVSARTSAILAVHTFGVPADIAALEEIAERHGLATIYDAAQAFGATYRGKSIVANGDASVLSLHATKIFHTVEGGAVILRTRAAYERALLAANNGMDASRAVRSIGINGRLSELHAAVGLCLLDNVDADLAHIARLAHELREALMRSSSVAMQPLTAESQPSHAFFAIVAPTAAKARDIIGALDDHGYDPRPYSDPPLNRHSFLRDTSAMPVAESIASRLLYVRLLPEAATRDMEDMAALISRVCPRFRIEHEQPFREAQASSGRP